MQNCKKHLQLDGYADKNDVKDVINRNRLPVIRKLNNEFVFTFPYPSSHNLHHVSCIMYPATAFLN